MTKRTVAERLWEKIDEDGPTPEHRPDLGPCWLWTAGLSRGYGSFTLRRGTTLLAHRFVYEWLVGPIPDGLELDHLCRNPPCVRPDHLERGGRKCKACERRWAREIAARRLARIGG